MGPTVLVWHGVWDGTLMCDMQTCSPFVICSCVCVCVCPRFDMVSLCCLGRIWTSGLKG